MKILVMGLPTSGKTYFSDMLVKKLKESDISTIHFNADAIREWEDDWDFSELGRIRQANRMGEYAEKYNSSTDVSIMDFVAPLPIHRRLAAADVIVYIAAPDTCMFEDTKKLFSAPEKYDFIVNSRTEFTSVVDDLVKFIKKFIV